MNISNTNTTFICFSKIAPPRLFLGMKRQFGEFHVDEHLEFAVDMNRGIFTHARVAAVNEHILTLELDQEDGSKRRVLGMADIFAFSKL
jgi:hypothetical protein